MKNKYLFFGTLIMVMAFALVLAGCATEGRSRTEAEQLASEINAIKEGSAVMDGAKVTLTSEVQLTTSLTVPAGVTLDVTANGAALGLGDVTLTVNGTVTAGHNAVHLKDDASEAIINGSGTIRLNSKGQLLEVQGNQNIAKRKLTLDGVTLVGIADNNGPLVQVGEGGEFVLKSGAIKNNTHIGEGWISGGGVKINGGTFTMDGGAISGNTVIGSGDGSGGAGVLIRGGEFTMKGGTISGNTAQTNGGGVRIEGGAVFTLEGGTIYGSSAGGGNANTAPKDTAGSLRISGDSKSSRAKWGTGGTYTKGGVSQTSGSEIVPVGGSTDETLIATPVP